MKRSNKNILIILMALSVVMTSCFEEKDDDFKVIGAVASIPVLTLSKTEPTAGEEMTVSFRYYSENIAVSELRLTETVGAGVASVVETKTVTNFDIKNSYEDSFVYTVPSVAVGTKIVLAVEVQTANDLVNSKSSTITIK